MRQPAKTPDLLSLGRLLEGRTEDELWTIYGLISAILRQKGYARSKNLTAERGENVALQVYNSTPGAAKLQLAPPGTKNVDAISRDGERYSIKTISEGTASMGTFQADDFTNKRFDYMILVILDEFFQPAQVLEATWSHVDRFKRMHKTMKAYNVPVTAKFKAGCRLIYRKEKEGVLDTGRRLSTS
jgi:hypothetical protein